MRKHFRLDEYKVLFYRILLAYIFYFFARVLFFVYNLSLLKVDSVPEFFRLCYHGLAFDTTAILYINSLFIIASILPFVVNTKQGYQKFLFYLYFITNLTAYATNFIDLIYYKFTFGRTTIAVMDSLNHETNKTALFFSFLLHYWHVFLLFFVFAFIWIYAYKKVKVSEEIPVKGNQTQHQEYNTR